MSAHVRRIEAVERDLKALADSSAGKEDLSRVRAEIKRLYDGLHVGEYSGCSLNLSDPDPTFFRIPRPPISCMGYS